MKLTPMDVRKQSFRKTMRGFDPEDVRVFLDMVADEYEELLQQNGMLNEKVRHLGEQIERYHGMEKTLQNSLLTAERVSEEAHDRSKLEAETIIEDARLRGERILSDSRERLRALSREVQGLHRQKELFVQRLQSFLQAQSDLIDARKDELGVVDELNLQAERLLVESDLPAMEMEEALPIETDDADVAVHTDLAQRTVQEDPAVAGGPESDHGEQAESASSSQKGFFEASERAKGFFEVGADEGARR